MARLFLMTMLVSESVLLVPVPVLVVLHFLLLRRSLPGLHFAHSAANGLSYVGTVPSGLLFQSPIARERVPSGRVSNALSTSRRVVPSFSEGGE